MSIPTSPVIWRYDTYTMERYADVLLWALTMSRNAPLKKSDLVLVHYDHEALPLAEAVVAELHKRGHLPVPRAEPTAVMQRAFLEQANNKRLSMEIPGDRELYHQLAGSIRLLAPEDPDALEGVDPELANIVQRGKKPLQDVLHRREQAGYFGWTVGLYPSQGGALAAGLPLEDYAREIETACLINQGSPVDMWRQRYRQMREATRILNELEIQSLRVQSESMDLLVRVGAQRRWLGLTGRNMPSFEIYTSPDWRGTEGVFHADMPSQRQGGRVSGIDLTFRYGEVVKLAAREGEQLAVEQLRIDPGAAKVGEFSLVDKRFSTISRFMAVPLYDENHGGEHGSCHIALGQAYANAFAGPGPLSGEAAAMLGFNNSALHWDLINTQEKEVYALLPGGGKELIYAKGQFTFL